MPNLAPRTSLRSLEAVRNSRSMEANLQSSGNRMSHLTHSPSTGNPTPLHLIHTAPAIQSLHPTNNLPPNLRVATCKVWSDGGIRYTADTVRPGFYGSGSIFMACIWHVHEDTYTGDGTTMALFHRDLKMAEMRQPRQRGRQLFIKQTLIVQN